MNKSFWRRWWWLGLLIGLILASFIPYVQVCTYEDDVGYCEAYYLHQPTWWQQVVAAVQSPRDNANIGRPEVIWDSWGRFYIWQEGIVDSYQALRGRP